MDEVYCFIFRGIKHPRYGENPAVINRPGAPHIHYYPDLDETAVFTTTLAKARRAIDWFLERPDGRSCEQPFEIARTKEGQPPYNKYHPACQDGPVKEAMVNHEKLATLLGSIGETMGLYPAAMKGFGEEKDYEQRDGFKNGWNAAVMEYGTAFADAVEDAKSGWDEDEWLLAAAGEGIFRMYKGKWTVFLNDTWYWGCADAEEIPEDKIKEVAGLFRDHGRYGAYWWVYKRRGDLPEFKDTADKIMLVEKMLEAK